MSEPVYSKFSVGSVFSSSFSAMKNNTVFYLIAVVVATAAYLAYNLFMQQIMSTTIQTGPGQFRFGNITVPAIISFLLYAFYNIFIINSTQTILSGKPVNISQYIQNGLTLLLPVIGVMLIYGILISIGLILLIIPGIFFALVFYLALPIRICEEVSIFEAMKRSSELTKGHRLAILAIGLILIVVYMFITSTVVGAGIAAAIMGGQFAVQQAFSLPSLIVNSLFYSLYLTVSCIFSTVVYHQLVAEKEGGKLEDVSEVFS